MRRTEDEVALMATLDPQQLLAVEAPAARFDPELGRLNGGHEQLDCTGPVHLLPHDRLHLFYGAKTERPGGVDSGSHFADHAGAHHQLLADDVGICRNVPQGVAEVSSPAHRFRDSWFGK